MIRPGDGSPNLQQLRSLTDADLDALSEDDALNLLTSLADAPDRAEARRLLKQHAESGIGVIRNISGEPALDRVLQRYLRAVAERSAASRQIRPLLVARANPGDLSANSAQWLSETTERPAVLMVPWNCSARQLRAAIKVVSLEAFRTRQPPPGAGAPVLLPDLASGTGPRPDLADLDKYQAVLDAIPTSTRTVSTTFGDLQAVELAPHQVRP